MFSDINKVRTIPKINQRIMNQRYGADKTEEKHCSHIHTCRPATDMKIEDKMSRPNSR